MSDAINTGGFAFPITEPTRFSEFGLTARDYFAAAALPGLVMLCANDDTIADGKTYAQHIAKNAYALADALIAEREIAKHAKEGAEP